MITYTFSIGCVLWRRWRHPKLLPRSRWGLGRWGIPVNLFGFLCSIPAFFLCFWPNATLVDKASFNRVVVMFVGVAIISMAYYFVGKACL